MRGLAEGRLQDPELLEEEAFLCLGCRACETACPSGVRYGEMLEHTRDAIRSGQLGPEAPTGASPGLAVRIERFALRRTRTSRYRVRPTSRSCGTRSPYPKRSPERSP